VGVGVGVGVGAGVGVGVGVQWRGARWGVGAVLFASCLRYDGASSCHRIGVYQSGICRLHGFKSRATLVLSSAHLLNLYASSVHAALPVCLTELSVRSPQSPTHESFYMHRLTVYASPTVSVA
jgi:hypothetical protein